MSKKELNDITRIMLFELTNNRCQCSTECLKIATDIHHMLPNTKVNRKLYPLFIESIFNKQALNNGCHLNNTKKIISEREAECCERWLELFLKTY